MGDVQELPSQPVPELGLTLDRYLAAVKPVVSAANYEKCKQQTQEFGRSGGLGHKLQEALIQVSRTSENWATDFWLDDMYLDVRLPLPVNSNPFFLFPKQQFHSTNDQLRFAAKIVLFALDYKRLIDTHELECESVPRGKVQQPLCMKTYENFFPAYRRPGEDKDELVMSTHQTEKHPLHVVVASKNQFFSVEVSSIGRENNINEDQLVDHLRLVMQMAKERHTAPPIGILTTENRTTWCKFRNRLLKKNVNGQSLQIIENCLLVLCLDDGATDVPAYSTMRKESTALELSAMAGHLLHGSGTPNRWYDKFIQVVVTRGGVAGVVVEHSASEGITVIKFCEEFLKRLQESGENADCHQEVNKMKTFPPPLPLHWDIDDEISNAVNSASKKMTKLYKDVDLFVHRFSKYGKNFIKSQGISPDAFVQVSLQLTYYKVHRRMVSTYESASLRRFHLGRVDNIRAATDEALAWVKAMCDDKLVAEETKVKLFQDCIRKQTEIMKYTILGEAPDNHLLALKELAKRMGIETPGIFEDKCYQEFQNFRLSTSQLPTAYGILVGYGPVVPDGYGCSYNICPDHIDFCISSFFSSKETSSDFWAHSLEGSLLHMRELCLKLKQMEQEAKTS